MHIVLVQLPFPILSEEPRHLSPPLGLAYMASGLKKAGCNVEIFDTVLEGYHQEWSFAGNSTAYGLDPDTIATHLAECNPDIVGLSCLFSSQDVILRKVAAAIRDRMPKATIVCGGTHPTVFARQMIAEGLADFVVRGEGELAIISLTQALSRSGDFAEVSGLVWRQGSEILENAVSRIDLLELLPLPARDCMNLLAYSATGIMHGESRSDVPATTIVTSRGCPGQCTFCSIHPVWGHRFRAASADRVLTEISELYHHFGIRHLLIEDDNFTFDQNRAKRILRAISQHFPDLTWSAPNGVAIWRLDEELIQLISQTGCRRLSLAVESGCPDTLAQLINKPLSLDQVEKVVRLCRRHGVRTTAFFVLGMPGETRDAMVESMNFAARLDVDTLTVMNAVPLPGSPLYDTARINGFMDPDTPFVAFATRNPIMTTSDFDPAWVDGLARRTMVRHAARHPMAYFRRIVEKMQAAPVSTMRALFNFFIALLRSRTCNEKVSAVGSSNR